MSVSPPSRAAWIEMQQFRRNRGQVQSPPSRAAWIEIIYRGSHNSATQSPPSRAAWIEMKRAQCETFSRASRRLHGRRGLKSHRMRTARWRRRRRLHGRRGLKCLFLCANTCRIGRRLHGRRGLKLFYLLERILSLQSPPSRAAWIEML